MLNRVVIKLCVYITISVFILSGCSEPAQPVTEQATPASITSEPAVVVTKVAPPGQLDETVIPVHYRLELKIDPSQETFTGSTSIDVVFNESVNSIWLHGKKLQFT